MTNFLEKTQNHPLFRVNCPLYPKFILGNDILNWLYMQNGYNFVGIFTKHEYPSDLKVWMEIVTDGTRTDFMQFTPMCC